MERWRGDGPGRSSLTVLGVLVVVTAVAVPVALRMRQHRVGAAARAAVDGFARAWPTGTLAAVHYAGTPGADGRHPGLGAHGRHSPRRWVALRHAPPPSTSSTWATPRTASSTRS